MKGKSRCIKGMLDDVIDDCCLECRPVLNLDDFVFSKNQTNMTILILGLAQLFLCFVLCVKFNPVKVEPKKCVVWGSGLKSQFHMPVRYFYIQSSDTDGRKFVYIELTSSALYYNDKKIFCCFTR